MVTACSTSAGELLSPSPPASSSTAVGGSEDQDKLRRRIDEYLLHEEYYKSVRGEDGEEPLEAFGSPPHTDMGSYLYSGPSTDVAETVSLPRRPRGSAWRPKLPTTSRKREVCAAYVEDSHLPGPTYGALDRTPELLAKLLSGSEDPDVTALSEAVRAKLGITQPLPKPALASPSPGLSTLADYLKRSRVTETERLGLTALAPPAGRLPPCSDSTSGGGNSGKPIAQANIQLELLSLTLKPARMGRGIRRVSFADRPTSCGSGH